MIQSPNFEIKKIPQSDFPFLLRQISGLPKTLDIIGQIPDDNHKFLCVIGSRKNSDYGAEACKKILHGLRGYPIVIVSGLAIGIDSLSHEIALEIGLKTISFPGSGLAPHAIYPHSRRPLARRIIESGGSLLSSFYPNQIPEKWTFAYRNRLMAGISHAVLIIEGRKGSGTLITAKYAEDFNRDILAVPGEIFSERSYGPHMLIKRGAFPVTCSEDILYSLGFSDSRPGLNSKEANNTLDLDSLNLEAGKRKVLEALLAGPLSASELSGRLSRSLPDLYGDISMLEISGLVSEIEGRYRIKRFF